MSATTELECHQKSPEENEEGGEVPLTVVSRKRKRKETAMDVTEAQEVEPAPVKRPTFPPVDASTTPVRRQG